MTAPVSRSQTSGSSVLRCANDGVRGTFAIYQRSRALATTAAGSIPAFNQSIGLSIAPVDVSKSGSDVVYQRNTETAIECLGQCGVYDTDVWNEAIIFELKDRDLPAPFDS